MQRKRDVMIPYYGVDALIEALTTLKEAYQFHQDMDKKRAHKKRNRRQ